MHSNTTNRKQKIIKGPNVGMPQFGSEPKFEPELFRTGPKFGPRFRWKVELDHKSGSRFEQGWKSLNLAEPGSNRTFFIDLGDNIFWCVCQGHVYHSLERKWHGMWPQHWRNIATSTSILGRRQPFQAPQHNVNWVFSLSVLSTNLFFQF